MNTNTEVTIIADKDNPFTQAAAGLEEHVIDAGQAEGDGDQPLQAMSDEIDQARPASEADTDESEDQDNSRSTVVPFDRLPEHSFFGAPPMASPYHTRRAEEVLTSDNPKP